MAYNRLPKKLYVFALLLIAACAAFASSVQIKTSTRPQTQVTVFDYVAWGVCSFKWNGSEFLDCYDHGRGMQSAVVYDQQGEALNPTQDGAAADGLTPNPSTSHSLSMSASGSVIQTQTQMAFWCGTGTMDCTAKQLSNTIHAETVTLGLGPKAQVAQVDIGFTIPADEVHTQAQFEILTGYMPAKFSHFRTYDPATQTLAEVTDGPGEQGLPLVFCTTRDDFCMGVISNTPLDQGGYGRWRFTSTQCVSKSGGGCVKWNAVSRVNSPTAGATYSYRIRVVTGVLADVTAGLDWAAANP